jgi:hypothetical protein
MNPWKDASRGVPGADNSVLYYVKCIADEGLTAGNPANSATITVAGDLVTYQIAEAAGSLANDTGIDYTSNSGSAGTATLADTNFNSVQDAINVSNGVGVGQTAFRRWKAALGDFPPAYALTSGDALARAATQCLRGRNDAGVSIFADTSALATMQLNVGIGTSLGATDGASPRSFPDYYEDIPGSSTTASVNTPVRSSASQPRKSQEAVTARKQYRITGWAVGAVITTSTLFTVRDIDNNIIWQEPFTSGAVVTFQDISERPIVGPIGSPLFVSVQGTTLTTDGSFYVRAEERFV